MRLTNRGVYLLLATLGIRWDDPSADVRLLLVNNSDAGYDADINFVSQISANELSTTNYARQTVGSRTVTENDTSNGANLDAADVSIANLGPATGGPLIGAAYVYWHVGADDTANPVIGRIPVAQQTNGSTVTIVINAAGLLLADSPS